MESRWVIRGLVLLGALGLWGCTGEPEPDVVDTDTVIEDTDVEDTEPVVEDTATDSDTDTAVEPVDQSFIRYTWVVDRWPNQNRVEAICDGKMVFEQVDFLSPSGLYEVRLDVEPGTECNLNISDALGEELPEGEVYVCDILQEVWVSQTGFGPVSVGAVTAELCVPGCMDPGAENFNAAATVADASCEYIMGCTDERANNYNPAATFDDGSCDWSGFSVGTVNFRTDFFPNETTIEVECGGYDVYYGTGFTQSNTNFSFDFIVDAGYDCVVKVSDSYGDQGASGSLWLCGEQLFEWPNTPSQGGSAYTLEVGSFFIDGCSGCTNSEAINFDPSAYVEDGSCKL